ncbi:MAG: class I tRNA ligase family protein, partial [Candidatus Thorarchaeota archaeon]
WHIECSAMAKKYLGETLDLSGGGEDNIFPHHENSIAQSEAANEKPYVRYWMHVRHLKLDGEKMSKSVGNLITVRDAVERYGATTLRLYLLSTHYRKPLTFKDYEIRRVHLQLERLRQVLARLHAFTEAQGKSASPEKSDAFYQKAKDTFEEALLDDLNTGRAINHFFQLVNQIQSQIETSSVVSSSSARDILAFLETMGTILFGDLYHRELDVELDSALKGLVEALVLERTRLRAQGRYEEADVIRSTLNTFGIELVDTKTQTHWWRKPKELEKE